MSKQYRPPPPLPPLSHGVGVGAHTIYTYA